jgi:hypothetical protein
MGIEQRGNRSYFYKKRRVGKRIVSEYVTGGHEAFLLAELDERDRAKLRDEREAIERERAAAARLDASIDELSEINESLVKALFLLHGFHQHKREWRRKRK